MQHVESSYAQSCAMTARKNHGPLPSLHRKRLTANYGSSLTCYEFVLDISSLSSRPLLAEHPKLKRVVELCFAQGGENESGGRRH